MRTWICGRFELNFQSGAHLLQCHLKLLPEKRPNNSQALQSHKTNKERSSDLSYVSLQSLHHRRYKRGFKDGLVFVDRILRNAISLTTTFLKVAITEKTHQTSAAHLTSKTRSTNHSAWIGLKNTILRPIWIRIQNWLSPTPLPSQIPPKNDPPILKNCNHTKPNKEQSLNLS